MMNPTRRKIDTMIGIYSIFGEDNPKRKRTTDVTCEH